MNKMTSLHDPRAGLSQEQLDSFWMPFTGNRQFKRDPRMLVSAAGHYYTDTEGRKVFDGLCGLWTCGLGHAHPAIAEAVARQVNTLDYAPAFQFGQPKAFELAHRITEFMPAGLNRVFFTDSGSESVDSALKIARAYWRKQGRGEKTRMVGRAKGYHGVNYGGISVGGLPANRMLYGQGIDAVHLPHTQLPGMEFSKGMPSEGAELANRLLDIIAMYDASTIAAVIVEPLSGSAGVIVPPEGYLARLRDICTQHDILLIFDEVITGFGRMGASTGAEAFGVTPDLMTTAKQLTNGVVPMGAVIARQDIYDCFMEQGGPDYMLELPHGYTYSAHPLGCAAGLATLQVLQEEQMFSRVASMAPKFEEAVHSLRGMPLITDIRNYGLATGFSIEHAPGEPALRPFQIAMAMWRRGFYVRYGADTIQLAMPFTVTNEEIDSLINALGDSINAVASEEEGD